MDTVEVLGQAYRPRVIEAALDRALAAAGAVLTAADGTVVAPLSALEP